MRERAVPVDEIVPVQVGPGCVRRDLPRTADVRAWVVDIAPGCQWPYVDVHDAAGEHVYVVSGELIEGDRRYPAGTYLRYSPNSTHRPRTETGVRLFGINLIAGGD